MTTKGDREKFINDIKIKLDLHNYGFQKDENNYSSNGYTFSEARNMKAIKELIIRMNLWIATGKEDKGYIEYPEAKRVIDYKLDGKNIGKCRVDLLKKR
jgi:hypothetical protein